MEAITFEAPQSRNLSISPALPKARTRAKCYCILCTIFRSIFSAKATMGVAFVIIALMWWHIISIDDSIAGGAAVANDLLLGLPWAIIWVYRTTREKGGDK